MSAASSGAVAAFALIGRKRLASDFGLGIVLWGAPLALIGAWPNTAVALDRARRARARQHARRRRRADPAAAHRPAGGDRPGLRRAGDGAGRDDRARRCARTRADRVDRDPLVARRHGRVPALARGADLATAGADRRRVERARDARPACSAAGLRAACRRRRSSGSPRSSSRSTSPRAPRWSARASRATGSTSSSAGRFRRDSRRHARRRARPRRLLRRDRAAAQRPAHRDRGTPSRTGGCRRSAASAFLAAVAGHPPSARAADAVVGARLGVARME